jgi:thiol-disulfide isomerase/thioredoxin
MMMMMSRLAKILVALAMSVAMTEAFSSTAFLGSSIRQRTCSNDNHALSMKAIDIDSEASFDKTIKEAGSKLVVVDYSTTWCGPCKVIAPKFDELSEKYPDSVFLKVSYLVSHSLKG